MQQPSVMASSRKRPASGQASAAAAYQQGLSKEELLKMRTGSVAVLAGLQELVI